MGPLENRIKERRMATLAEQITALRNAGTRDSQRSKLYRWETPWKRDPSMTLPECRKLINRVYKAFGFDEAPVVKDGRGRYHATGSTFLVVLPRWARTKEVVLHEATHGLNPGWGGGHGPVFARLYIELLVRYCGYSRRRLGKTARAGGLKIAPRPVATEVVRLYSDTCNMGTRIRAQWDS